MAKTILTSILLVTTICVKAQESIIFQQNRVLMGGGVSFSFYDRDNTNTDIDDPISNDYVNNNSHFTFTPIFGVFSKDFVMLGVKPTITRRESTDYYNNSDYESNWEHRNYEYGASIFITHMYPLFKRFGASLEHAAGYTRINGTVNREWQNFDNGIIIDEREFEHSEKGNRYFAGMSVHLYYSLTDNFLIQTKIGQLSYSHGTITTTDNQNDGETLNKQTISSGTLNFITTLSFDKILTFNYLF